jgi:hypothetical protein
VEIAISTMRATATFAIAGMRLAISNRHAGEEIVAIEGLDHAVKAMLANAFLNLSKFPDDREGNGRLRRIIDYLILIDGDIHGASRPCTTKSPTAGCDRASAVARCSSAPRLRATGH